MSKLRIVVGMLAVLVWAGPIRAQNPIDSALAGPDPEQCIQLGEVAARVATIVKSEQIEEGVFRAVEMYQPDKVVLVPHKKLRVGLVIYEAVTLEAGPPLYFKGTVDRVKEKAFLAWHDNSDNWPALPCVAAYAGRMAGATTPEMRDYWHLRHGGALVMVDLVDKALQDAIDHQRVDDYNILVANFNALRASFLGYIASVEKYKAATDNYVYSLRPKAPPFIAPQPLTCTADSFTYGQSTTTTIRCH